MLKDSLCTMIVRPLTRSQNLPTISPCVTRFCKALLISHVDCRISFPFSVETKISLINIDGNIKVSSPVSRFLTLMVKHRTGFPFLSSTATPPRVARTTAVSCSESTNFAPSLNCELPLLLAAFAFRFSITSVETLISTKLSCCCISSALLGRGF